MYYHIINQGSFHLIISIIDMNITYLLIFVINICMTLLMHTSIDYHLCIKSNVKYRNSVPLQACVKPKYCSSGLLVKRKRYLMCVQDCIFYMSEDAGKLFQFWGIKNILILLTICWTIYVYVKTVDLSLCKKSDEITNLLRLTCLY